MSDDDLFCSFCGENSKNVNKLIAGPTVYICDNCITLCWDILNGKATPGNLKDKSEDSSIPSPKKIKEFLDQYVIDQEIAKMSLSVAVYNHYKRLDSVSFDDVELEKSNILLLGPTGSGKTLLVQTIAKFLDVPFVIADATSLTESGYMGDDVESIIMKLVRNSEYDIKKAERGIIFIDEIDKKKMKGSSANTRDVSGEGVQQALLKIMEGTEILIPTTGMKKTGITTDMLKLNTKNILFIVGGAFVGLEKIIEKSMNNRAAIGFGSQTVGKKIISNDDIMEKIKPEHLVEFGMIPEFIGRVPVITHLNELTEDILMRIMIEPKNAIIKQYIKLFSLDNIELTFEDDALREIAKNALARKTGARGIRGVIEKYLMKIQFNRLELSESGVKKIIITKDVILNSAEPVYIN